jgi:alkylation response protein AidB-like acyl-CoA dehydrogenase
MGPVVTDAGHLDLSYSAEQDALADSVRGVVARWQADGDEESAMPWRLWKGLAGLGVLGLATAEGGGGVQEVAAVMEVLGEAAAPGPLVGTFMAVQLVGQPERDRLAGGDSIGSVGTPPLLPWAPVADVFVELAPDGAWLAGPQGEVEAVETLAGEPWGRVRLERLSAVDETARRQAGIVGDVAVAAYLAGAAGHLVAITSQWLQDRVQFGRPIGEFQSLAHPLADVAIRTRAARALTRIAAYAADSTDGRNAPTAAATARLSATRAAVDATYRAHQSFGALGFTVEGPVARVGQRVRQVSLHPPGPGTARQLVVAGAGI